MKNLKLIVVIVTLFLLNNVVGAQKQTEAKTNKTASQMVEKINADVSLTPKQKQELLQSTKDYLENLRTASNQKDKELIKKKQKEAYESFKTLQDSALTKEQKAKRITKIHERKQALTNNITNK